MLPELSHALELAEALEGRAAEDGSYLGPTDSLLAAKALRAFARVERDNVAMGGHLVVVAPEYAARAKAILEKTGCVAFTDDGRSPALYAII